MTDNTCNESEDRSKLTKTYGHLLPCNSVRSGCATPICGLDGVAMQPSGPPRFRDAVSSRVRLTAGLNMNGPIWFITEGKEPGRIPQVNLYTSETSGRTRCTYPTVRRGCACRSKDLNLASPMTPLRRFGGKNEPARYPPKAGMTPSSSPAEQELRGLI